MKNTQNLHTPLAISPRLQPDSLSCVETVAQLVTWAENILRTYEVDTPRLDAEVLLAHTLHISRSCLYTRLQEMVSDSRKNDFRRCVVRRTQREPVAYITGRQEFWSLEFQVTPCVLIPRPDTEILVETALRLLATARITAPRILDMGTGSGCIAVTLATELPRAQVWAVDRTHATLSIAQKNAHTHRVGHRITFACGDLFAPVPPGPPFFDLLVTNPPYIDSQVLDTLQPEVRAWEPRAALDGGADGLDFYGRLLYDSPDYLRPGGWLVAEIGEAQKDAVVRLGQKVQLGQKVRLGQTQRHLRFRTCRQDYAGRDRVVVFRKTADVEQ
ncbi:MAG: peptide chain release factor N(5)-glutamine methyltransferase [Desulfurellaceae bacterium]|nr:peptide chain release factor N(5)-glutamine methyltransferase [Desulfurellaceae bacterium]